MRQDGESTCEGNFPERKTEKINRESRMEDSSPEEKVHKSSNVQLAEKLKLTNIKPTVRRALPNVPSIEPTGKRSLPRIPVNEVKKARQRPRRILPCLPPVVQEILRWSIHPEQVLRGAASVSHLFSLSAIEEENLPSVHMTETIGRPSVPRVRRILPSTPPTGNRSLPSKQPSAAGTGKPLPKFRAEFKERMQPTLATIKERASPRLSEVKSPLQSHEVEHNEAPQSLEQKGEEAMFSVHPEDNESQNSGQKDSQSAKRRKQEKLQKRNYRVIEEYHTRVLPTEKEEAPDFQPMNGENRRSHESTAVQTLLRPLSEGGKTADHQREDEKLLHVQRKVKESQKSRQLTANEALNFKEPRTKQKVPRPAQPTRRSKASPQMAEIQTRQSFQRGQNQRLPNDQPKVARTRAILLSADGNVLQNRLARNETEDMPRLQAKLARRSAETVFQPLGKAERLNSRPDLTRLQQTQGRMTPKPPSTPKPTVTRTQPKIQRPLPSIQRAKEPMLPTPPPSPKPTVTRTPPKIHATVNRPLPNIQRTQEPIIPKPPSTPKPTVTRTRPKIRATVSRPLPDIQPVEKQAPPSLQSSSLETLVKQPLPSIQREENYCSATGVVQPTKETNFETVQRLQGNMRRDEQQ